MGSGGIPGRLSAKAGHLAVWLGLYFEGAYVSAALMLGRTPALAALVSAFCAGVGLYLLDRVKPMDRWLDPSDRVAHPERHDFLLARRGRVRVLAWGLLGVGALAAVWMHPLNLLLPPIGIAGVIVYGSVMRGRPRPKDVLLVKNLLPGAAIAGLAVILAWQGPAVTGPGLAQGAGVLGVLLVAVTADAMLCDLDDVKADAAHGTATVPIRLGRRATWAVALAMHACACAGAVGIARGGGSVGVVWAAADLGLTALLWALNPPAVRDLVDLKLPAVALVTWAMA